MIQQDSTLEQAQNDINKNIEQKEVNEEIKTDMKVSKDETQSNNDESQNN